MEKTSVTDSAVQRLGIDPSRAAGRPSLVRFFAASLLALAASLGAAYATVRVSVSLVPSLRDYSHFRLFDYGGLTVVGVVAACAGWLGVVHLTPAPRRLFLRLAVVVTLALVVPDISLLLLHSSPDAVAVLVVMHVIIGVITYNCLVHLAPSSAGRSRRRPDDAVPGRAPVSAASSPGAATVEVARRAGNLVAPSVWRLMCWAVTAELLIGFAFLVFIPFHHPSGWIVEHNVALSLTHAALGAVLGVGAVSIFLLTLRGARVERIAGSVGLGGVVFSALGGALCYESSLRIVGAIFMFLGVMTALFGYFMPLIGESPGVPPTRVKRVDSPN